ncbi:MAG: hypothetical protein AAB837_01895 [Patescibacteria group bacterium]
MEGEPKQENLIEELQKDQNSLKESLEEQKSILRDMMGHDLVNVHEDINNFEEIITKNQEIIDRLGNNLEKLK